jgi:DNA-binding transcriptional regulator YiaG
MMTAEQQALVVERVKYLYKTVCDKKLGNNPKSVQRRIAIVRELEASLGTDFRDTQDFHFKVRSFLARGATEGAGDQLKKAKKDMGLSQIEMAKVLKCSQQLVSKMEKGKVKLSRKAVEFINSTKVHSGVPTTLQGRDEGSKISLEKNGYFFASHGLFD